MCQRIAQLPGRSCRALGYEAGFLTRVIIILYRTFPTLTSSPCHVLVVVSNVHTYPMGTIGWPRVGPCGVRLSSMCGDRPIINSISHASFLGKLPFDGRVA